MAGVGAGPRGDFCGGMRCGNGAVSATVESAFFVRCDGECDSAYGEFARGRYVFVSSDSKRELEYERDVVGERDERRKQHRGHD